MGGNYRKGDKEVWGAPMGERKHYSTNDKYTPPEPPEPTKPELIEKAKKNGLWFFDPQLRQWHTPEEFEKMWNGDIIKRIQLKDPYEFLETAHKKLLEFTMRLLIYFKK